MKLHFSHQYFGGGYSAVASRLTLRSNRARLQRRRIAGDGLTTPDPSAQSLEGRGSGSGRPLELAIVDWLEELAVYGTARNLGAQELAYQLSLVIENAYLVRLALRQSDKPELSRTR